MRFKTDIANIAVFTKLVSSLNSISKTAWLKLDEEQVHFTLSQDGGVQVFATLSKETLFTTYRIASASSNTINLELPLPVLLRALRSCASAPTATLRLTKRAADNVPLLALTVAMASSPSTLVTQEVPVRVLAPASVAGITEPVVPHPDVSVVLPSLGSIKGVVERMVKIEGEKGRVRLEAWGGGGGGGGGGEGKFRMGVESEEVEVKSVWVGLKMVGDGEEREGEEEGGEEEGWVGVSVNGKDWAKVLRCAGLAKSVVACFINDMALVVYVYLNENEDDTAVITYYLSSLAD